MNELEKNQAVQWLQDMVRFKTISGEGPTNGDYVRCANWLLEISTSIGLEANILEESKEGKPIVVVKWSGSDTTLSVVILNSHYDVVPGK